MIKIQTLGLHQCSLPKLSFQALQQPVSVLCHQCFVTVSTAAPQHKAGPKGQQPPKEARVMGHVVFSALSMTQYPKFCF